MSESHRSHATVVAASLFSLTVLAVGYSAFGFWTTMIFTSGFLGGLVLWLCFPATPEFRFVRAPFIASFVLFIVHRIEEKQAGFFAALADLTGVDTPAIMSWQVIALVVLSVGAWLLAPVLIKRGFPFGYYLGWTFFAAMGITELAHFIFPLFKDEPYGYFPGMGSVVLLAPLAWWGMFRLAGKSSSTFPAGQHRP